MSGDTTCETCVKRRDLLSTGVGAMALAGAAAAAVPVIDSLAPNPDDVAVTTLDIDLHDLAPGTQRVVAWAGKPILVVHRTPQQLAILQSPALFDRLRDPQSKVLQQGAYAANWHRSIDPAFLVVVGICTHLGCVPRFDPQTDGNGWLCPCHNSHFDLSGRVLKGSPAPYNLPVPPYAVVKPGTLRLGENPAGSSFSLADIVQI
ncbi:ubiquinol-cytochrome c reductase iron-sulfur subunit [Endobacter medicaginis]|jgi:ubiquinol-cytochrome c reductase iron-sulfur subunit|uniref:Ubiquinol-cytochrome c reductase iron-sulfur subunit n=1 Tax=Endobacter medicaginis TaxID=1181271 RepID=A0A850NMI1_9PROT|nr:ubiquinol-cytochrome c reductase iron-sulfur subunit [Endobacter medicaginis]MBB3173956.1 ubiquinol-cytochrome c reductase iron-sulfur subunit [Endobacter medicaginis]MCX5475186.1 ubiquinol-cytochrome c reductase iron-sulfur subunit [Endobacter medicaginis]NVN30783.1 ubiquinol-cytochrome c reductase iron-sulfur subunit [Endobacter medicaginis]